MDFSAINVFDRRKYRALGITHLGSLMLYRMLKMVLINHLNENPLPVHHPRSTIFVEKTDKINFKCTHSTVKQPDVNTRELHEHTVRK